jgi:hypothetical protein
MANGEVGFVYPDQSRMRGFFESEFGPTRLLGPPRSLRVLASHREEVKRHGDGFSVVAKRGSVRIDACEHPVRPI